MGKLDGKVAVVTGASRGIGKEIAKLFAAEGASVACAARTLTEGSFWVEGSLESTVSEIQEAGGSALIVQCDVSDPEACGQLVDAARQKFGPIDVLVNDAAAASWGPTKDIALEDWLNGFAVVVSAPFLLSQKVLPNMLERGSGAIVNVSSWMAAGPGRGPYDSANMMGETAYGTVKAALERLTQGLAQEVYPNGITVAAIAPCLGVPTPQLVARGTIYRTGRSQRRVPGADGGGTPSCHRAAGQGHRPCYIQPGNPAGVRFDGCGYGNRHAPCRQPVQRAITAEELRGMCLLWHKRRIV